MANRKKVILHRKDGWEDDCKLALTQEQINLLNWLLNENLISSDNWDLQVLDDADQWVTV